MNTTEPQQVMQYVTARQLAERLQVHPESIRRAIREGRIPAIRVGTRSLRIALTAVEAMEAANRVQRRVETAP